MLWEFQLSAERVIQTILVMTSTVLDLYPTSLKYKIRWDEHPNSKAFILAPSCTYIHTPFNGPLSRTTWVSRYQKGKTNLDFTEARDSEWQWHQLGHMQVCTSLQTDNHASTPALSFLQAGCPSCRPTNSVKAPSCMHLNVFCVLVYVLHSTLRFVSV